MPTQFELSAQMVAQLRLLDPSMSAEVGTPERKIIDTVAQALNDSQIDLSALGNALDIDSKYGSALDRLLTLFGFARQISTFATGFVTFSRTTASTVDIRVPAATQVRAPALFDTLANSLDIDFYTLYDVILTAGTTEITVPVRANVAGNAGNLPANRITEMVGTPVLGITSATNPTPTTGGKDAESDDEFKVRFKNTVFRNLAGTEDQYLALAVALAFSTRANIVGPQSHYREYVQIPSVADNTSYDINGDNVAEAGNGNAGEYTTSLSTIPYAKTLWTNLPFFVSNGQTGALAAFYRQDVDFRVNTTTSAKNRGDAYRMYNAYATSSAPQPNPNDSTIVAPNVTFINVYTGASASVTAVRPGDVVLLEFSYLSDASRNDLANGVTNAVDVYVDGENPTFATNTFTRPTSASMFVDVPSSKFYYENYRRIGHPNKRPILGNILTPLFWQPVIDLPDSILVGTVTYVKDVHYWAVEDVSTQGGTIRSRNGIEWSNTVNGKAATDSDQSDAGLYTGKLITDPTGDPTGGLPFEITAYTYDRNINDLQASLEGAKQVTTDVLAHRATRRYFKFDVTVMYAAGASIADTNLSIQDAVDRYLRSQYFGTAVQLSDILQTIHNVSGVDNVRWTSDIPLPTGAPAPVQLPRVVETNSIGRPLTNVTMDRIQPGNVTRAEIQGFYITGQPVTGTFYIASPTVANTTPGVTFSTWTATNVAAAISSLGITGHTVTEDVRPTTGVKYPIRSFHVTYGVGTRILPTTAILGVAGGPFVYNNDFFLRDNELAQLPVAAYTPPSGIADTVSGLIIRPRAQGTWTRGV
jgi:uncharacterized phage protein gp47/JayE